MKKTAAANLGVLAAFLMLAAVHTRPLLQQRDFRIASDPGDPVLTASLMYWNATVLPFSEAWWTPPFFYPTEDHTAFTEHLVGISVISTPVFWLTHNPIAAYNIVFFLAAPLCAFATYLLVLSLTRRHDAAVVAGLAYGFSPYRTAEMGHIQSLAAYGLPVVLLGLHRYVETSRGLWLAVFGGAWLLQSLSSAYYMVFGGVLVTMWIAYFCSAEATRRAAGPVAVTWMMASLALVPVLWKYHAVHEHYGLRRSFNEVQAFSAPLEAWAQTAPFVRFWAGVLPHGKDDLFPGATVVVLVIGYAVARLFTRAAWPAIRDRPRGRRGVRLALIAILALAGAAAMIFAARGPWRVAFGEVMLFRMDNLDRAVLLLVLSGGALIFLTLRPPDAVRRRSPFLFYVLATCVLGILCCGPVLRWGGETLIDPAPYRGLMYLPGFDQIRVPTRFWMLGVLCLATAAGLALSGLTARRRLLRLVLVPLAAAGVLADGWLREMPMAAAPEIWSAVEPSDAAQPILEVPLGPSWDAAATFRSMAHRRRVANGVSGFDPPHYAPLRAALEARDPDILAALASLGSFDVIVDGAEDGDGSWARFVSGAPGARRIASDGTRTVFRFPAGPSLEAALGAALPIAGALSFLRDGSAIADGRVETEWGDHPQRPGQWIQIDLGAVHAIGGITHALGEYARDFPRTLAIDVSTDGAGWETVWQGRTAGLAFLAAIREPRAARMPIAFTPRPARYLRLRQLAEHQNMWRVAELRAHAPASERPRPPANPPQ